MAKITVRLDAWSHGKEWLQANPWAQDLFLESQGVDLSQGIKVTYNEEHDHLVIVGQLLKPGSRLIHG
jgi:hypothetical protein